MDFCPDFPRINYTRSTTILDKNNNLLLLLKDMKHIRAPKRSRPVGRLLPLWRVCQCRPVNKNIRLLLGMGQRILLVLMALLHICKLAVFALACDAGLSGCKGRECVDC